jgi:ATP-dependent protease HslVU (ClpYQ) peptidase subunit
MTTIALNIKDREMAADGRCTSSTLIVSDNTNKFDKVAGCTFAICGNVSDIEALIDAYFYGPKHEDTLQAEGLVLDMGEAYLVHVLGGECTKTPITENYAIGSGCDFALAAMDLLGCTAKEAVKYAMKRDCATGGRIRVVKF